MRALDFKQMMSIDSDKIEEYESDAILKTYLRNLNMVIPSYPV